MLNLDQVHASWRPYIIQALQKVDPYYIERLVENPNWLPGPQKIFNAFSIPLEKTEYILVGESPYPRKESANGYAFWDAKVEEIWSDVGLSKAVNKATSLRNILKMLLVAAGLLSKDQTTPDAIRTLDKKGLVLTLNELFNNFLAQGFLLLNATFVYDNRPVAYHAQMWRPFLEDLFENLHKHKYIFKFILLGNVAKICQKINALNHYEQFHAEHPYNLSFISNPIVLEFFEPFQLLKRR